MAGNMMTNAKGGANFPKPYVDSVNQDDPMMERVPLNKMDIGARASGMPKGEEVNSSSMNIEHVGGTAGRK